MRSILLALLLLLSIFTVNAQQCQGPGREPGTAQAVCGNLTFIEKQISNCQGPDLPNPSSGCGQVTTDNSLWYKFHCYQAGAFSFLISPQSPTDDFDWEIMDVTGKPLSTIYTTELRVSLNLSGQTGPTGCTAAGTSDVNCGGGVPGSQFNRPINLVAGHDYLMMVNNWSSSGLGYNIDFSGTAVLTDNSLPTITDVSMVGCDATKLKVTFSEDILCNTITLLGTEFTVIDATHLISGVASSCTIGANSVPSVIINLQSPIPPGSYQLIVGDGSDGNTFENVCRRRMLPVTVPFNIAVVPPVAVDAITFSGCAPTVLDVKLTKAIWCNSATFQGTEFSILPGNPLITSVQATCSGATPYADILHITLQSPLPHGSYQLAVHGGTDGNTFIDTCNNAMVPATTPFVINQTTTAPLAQSIVFDECRPNKVVVNFDKPVLCNSISPAGNDFSISPGTWPILNATYTCLAGGYTTQVILTLQNPLPAGNFNVNFVTGADGNTVGDTCYAFMVNGYSKSFVTTKAPTPKYDSLQVDKCDPTQVKIFYSKAIDCGSVYIPGIEFYITGPAPVNIVSVSGDPGLCTTSKWLLLTLAQPITTFGTYVLHNRWGPDGNSVLDICGAAQDTTERISFAVLGKPSAAFTSLVKFGCKMDTVTFTHPGGNGINSWTWSFADGSSATGQTVIKTFPVSTTSTSIQLKVDNGFCSDIITQDVTLDNAFQALFAINPKDTVCINTPINFTNNSTGKNLQYLWLFDDNTQFAGLTPPPHVYISSKIYNIKLAVTDPYGCTDTAKTILNITPAPTIDFTGLSPQYCSDKTISLVRNISSNIYTYTWDNGNGLTIKDQSNVQFSYPAQGKFMITLTGTDRYCGTTSVAKPVDIFAVPKIALGNDTVLCPAVSLQIGPSPVNGYTYLWSNGATTSQIFTDIFTANYSLQVDNNGCKAADAISVKVLGACIITIPNAFTPNNDGNNDKLQATNADLAKEFSLKVYNRFGELMYASTDPLAGWDGMHKGLKADAGTYVWQLRYIDPWNFKKVVVNGTTILLR